MQRPFGYATAEQFHLIPDALFDAPGQIGPIVDALERADTPHFRPGNMLPAHEEWSEIFRDTALRCLVSDSSEQVEYKLATERLHTCRASQVRSMREALATMTLAAARARTFDFYRNTFLERAAPGTAASCAREVEKFLEWFEASLAATPAALALVGHSRAWVLPCLYVPSANLICAGCRKTIDANSLCLLAGGNQLDPHFDEPLRYHPACAAKAAVRDFAVAVETLERAAPGFPELAHLKGLL